MNVTLAPGARRGTVRAPLSKSAAHRLLIGAALGGRACTLRCAGALPRDVRATADCLRALGAEIEADGARLRVTPLRSAPGGVRMLRCGESGSTLRFLLPVAGALGARAVFCREGRLPERPLAPLAACLCEHGMTIREDRTELCCEGELLAGDYSLDGGVSSQYITGLLFALPLLRGDSTLTVAGAPASAPYIAMTEETLRAMGVRFEKNGSRYEIPGNQRCEPAAETEIEGDWSGAAAFLCMGALSREVVRVEGLRPGSVQGDRAIVDILRRFGAEVEETERFVAARRGALRGCTVDAAQTPDLVPPLAALAACAEGETRIVNAARLRDKESDRLRTTAALLRALGAEASETSDTLLIHGGRTPAGGTADASNDHRIAMAAAVAACGCAGAVTVEGAECVDKSYPAFWEDYACLSM